MPGSSTTLTFVESEDRFSIYCNIDGDEVFLQHGTGKRLVEFDTICLTTWWSDWCSKSVNNRYRLGDFTELLRESITDPDEADQVAFCADCQQPEIDDDLYGTGVGTSVCEPCRDEYWYCNRCEELYPETISTLHDTEICRSCQGNYYSYCDHCEGYYPDDYASDHLHDGSGCCESPLEARKFQIRNDSEILEADTLARVVLPEGIISDEGVGAIANFLRDHAYNNLSGEESDHLRALSFMLHSLGPEWQTRKGNYTKRLSRLAHEMYKLKLKPEIMSQVGCIARDHSMAVDFDIETTRDLNQSAEAFGHEDSCWWQSYYASRCILKSNGGFGLRTFSEQNLGGGNSYKYVTGRAWVIPLKVDRHGNLTPTFETLKAHAYVVFNGYDDLEGYAPARILSHMFGMTYRKVGFSCGEMFVNSDSGYLVASEEIAEGYTDGCLSLRVSQHSNLFHQETMEMANA